MTLLRLHRSLHRVGNFETYNPVSFPNAMVVTRNFVTAYSIKHLCESISQGCSGPGKQYRVSFQRLVDKVGIFVRHIIAVGEMVRHGIDTLLEQNVMILAPFTN